MHKAILGVALVSAIALSSGLALARPGAGGHDGFSRIDADNDGSITKAEFALGRDKMFDKLDANHDGSFTREEAKASADAWRKKAAESGKTVSPERELKHKERTDRMFNEMDTDKNGVISKAEFVAGGDKLFARLDANGDGKIVKGEGGIPVKPTVTPPAKQ